ncbi:MAG: hypothetical protein COB17_07840 [Sulfurimonas sp.]|nr:MAG: hypothetical protein COB17_07840 [Sulfurimonas sp.]
MIDFSKFGEKVDGYDVRVINEREARAAAGILFVLGILSLTNSLMLGHVIVTKYFISFFTFDFLIRVINPSYSPSLLIGRFFVQNQKPEYVGASQKRFAWSIGLLLALPMFYLIVINFLPNPIKVIVCIICLVLLISESAFSICLGCMIYNLVNKDKAVNCPGGVCEVREKDNIQKFSTAQKIIAIFFTALLFYGIYAYFTKVENKTFFMNRVSTMMMSDAEIQAIEDGKYQQEVSDFEDDNNF